MSRLERLKAHAGKRDLSASEVADILGVDARIIYDLIHQGDIECLAVQGQGRRRAEHRLHFNRRHTYHFEPRQVLAYIVRETRGDRLTVMTEIELLFPQWLPFAKRVAAQAKEHAEAPRLPLRSPRTKPQASHWRDAFYGHPEMFPVESLARPSHTTTTASNP